MKRETKIFVINTILSIIVLGSIVADKMLGIVSHQMFLESSNPAFYNLFWADENRKGKYSAAKLDSRNLLVLDSKRICSLEGVIIELKDDGSMAICGNNKSNEKLYFHLTDTDRYELPDGDYIISSGNEIEYRDDLIFYYETWKEKLDGTMEYRALASEPHFNSFTISNDLFDGSGLTLSVSSEFNSMDPLTIYPQIRRAGDPSDEFEPPAILKTTIDEGEPAFQTFLVDKSEFDQLTDGDWKIFKNNLKYQYHGTYVWTSIIFEDGTGVQFKDSDANQAVYGPIDPWGRVDEPVCEVHSLDEIKAAYQPV